MLQLLSWYKPRNAFAAAESSGVYRSRGSDRNFVALIMIFE